MKTQPHKLLVLLLFLAFTAFNGFAQNDKKQKQQTKENITNLVTVEEDHDKTAVKFPGGHLEVRDASDTVTTITLGHKRFDVIDDYNRTRIRMARLPHEKFKGHWAGIDMGFNGLMTSDFSTNLPSDAQFMDLNFGKSINFSINFLQYNIGLQRHKNNIGMVIGAGWTFYNYRTDNQYILTRDENGNTNGFPTDRSVKKNKLATNFFNFPLLFEFQIPTNNGHRFFISAGGYCGFLKKAHSKVVYNDNGSKSKDKHKGNLNVQPFQYGTMVRMGYRWVKLYATYNFSSLYMEDKGPELYPFTIGLTLLSF